MFLNEANDSQFLLVALTFVTFISNGVMKEIANTLTPSENKQFTKQRTNSNPGYTQ